MEKFDVCIIGAGIGGLMAAYKLKAHNPGVSVIIVEKGQTLERRKCPASAERGCVHCGICAITNGYGGAGVLIGPSATAAEVALRRVQIAARPADWVAQEVVALSSLPPPHPAAKTARSKARRAAGKPTFTGGAAGELRDYRLPEGRLRAAGASADRERSGCGRAARHDGGLADVEGRERAQKIEPHGNGLPVVSAGLARAA